MTRIFLEGDRDAAASLIPLARKYLGMLEADKYRNFYKRTLEDGSTIIVDSKTNPANIKIFSPVSGTGKNLQISRIVCEPTVYSSAHSSFIKWGAPFTDVNGNPINPPMGTINGSHPEILIDVSIDGNVVSYKVDHRKDAEVGNIDWVWNANSKKTRYLSWAGPWGRCISPDNENQFQGASNLNGYRSVIASVTGLPINRRFYIRWETDLFLDGEKLIDAPNDVFGAAIADFDGVEYVVALCTSGSNLLSDDRLYTIKISDTSMASPVWNDLGLVDWGSIFSGQVVVRDFCHFFDPSGKKAIATNFYHGIFNHVTTRLELTSPTTFVTSFEEAPIGETTYISVCTSTSTSESGTQTISTSASLGNVRSDYDPFMGEEKHLKGIAITEGSSSGSSEGDGVSLDSGAINKNENTYYRFSFDDETFVIDEFSDTESGTVSVEDLNPDLSATLNSRDTISTVFIVDCRYGICLYRRRDRIELISETGRDPNTDPNPTCGSGGITAYVTTSSSELEGVYLNSMLLLNTISNNSSSGPFASCSQAGFGCPAPSGTLIIPAGTPRLVLPGQFAAPAGYVPGNRFPYIFYTSEKNGIFVLSFYWVSIDDIGNPYNVLFNHIGTKKNFDGDRLSIISSLIDQPQYNEVLAPTHSNPGVF